MARYIVGISGASGVILAYRLIEILATFGHNIDVVMSRHASYTAQLELGHINETPTKVLNFIPESLHSQITIHSNSDVGASIGSGSYPTDGMIIIPCSMATLAAIAYGLADNCLRRAADVVIKEKRKLILVARETPLSEIHLENMLKLAKIGAIILPPVPAWYTLPETLLDVENFIIGKVLDALGIQGHNLYKRWKC